MINAKNANELTYYYKSFSENIVLKDIFGTIRWQISQGNDEMFYKGMLYSDNLSIIENLGYTVTIERKDNLLRKNLYKISWKN